MTSNPDSYKVTNHDRPFGVAPESLVDGIGWGPHILHAEEMEESDAGYAAGRRGAAVGRDR